MYANHSEVRKFCETTYMFMDDGLSGLSWPGWRVGVLKDQEVALSAVDLHNIHTGLTHPKV